jgi:hypothetical protein
MAQIYCGNKANYPGLQQGTHVIGTNYQCLQRGIGIGSHLPYDASYALPYEPIDDRKFYCGQAAQLPPNNFAFGSPSKCLQIGVGVGKVQRAALGPNPGPNPGPGNINPGFGFNNPNNNGHSHFIKFILPFLIIILLGIGTFLILYFSKLDIVSKKNKQNKKIIDWEKFIPYFILFIFLESLVVWLIWTKLFL